MSTRRDHAPAIHSDSDHPQAVPIGWVGLMTPFLLVLAVMVITGRGSSSQVAMTLALLAIPLAILALRHRGRTLAARAMRHG